MNAAAATRRIAGLALVGGLGGGLVFPILPALGLQLGIPAFMVGLILSANRISRLIFNLPAGHLIGRLGPRVILSGALAIETVGVLGYSAALHFGQPMWWLLGGRLVFGVGTAFLLVGAQAAVLGLSERADRGRKTAVVRVAISVAVPAGLVLGGILADLVSDDAAFLTGAAITSAGAALAATLLPRLAARPAGPERRPGLRAGIADLLGSPNLALVVAACGFNLLVFLTVQGVLLSTMVVLVARRDIHMFGMQAQGTSGLVMAVLIGCSALVGLGIGRVSDRLRLRASLLAPALMGMAAGFALLGMAHSLALVLLGAVCLGLSYNGVTLPMLALLGDAVDERQHGPAAALYQFFGDIGGTIGPMLGIAVATQIGVMPLYLGLAVLPLLGLPVALRLRVREGRMRGGE